MNYIKFQIPVAIHNVSFLSSNFFGPVGDDFPTSLPKKYLVFNVCLN